MSDLKLFRIDGGTATELASSGVALEKHLQTLIERDMETLFGVRFLATEYSTGVRHGGRIDSLGIDENGSPVIFEYKCDVAPVSRALARGLSHRRDGRDGRDLQTRSTMGGCSGESDSNGHLLVSRSNTALRHRLHRQHAMVRAA